MLKKLLSLAMALGLAFSILLPSTFAHAENEEIAATEEAADEEEADDEESEDAEESDEEESESTAAADDESEDLTIYFYVVGFVVVLILVMYAFTEGMRKK